MISHVTCINELFCFFIECCSKAPSEFGMDTEVINMINVAGNLIVEVVKFSNNELIIHLIIV